ncbi:MAG TPA: phosphatase PAP2 family protein [Gemmatimonadales bacterium]|nr:phosphatase PAP2 family protein [Gemmatimonadales bacterium]
MTQVDAEHRIRPVEYLVGGYLVITSALAVIRLESQPACVWVLAANALYFLLIALFVRAELGPLGKGLREIFPLVLLTSTYGGLDVLNNFGAVPTHDQWAMHADQVLFGGQISRVWWQAHPSRFLSTVFHASYFAYYPIVALPVLYFLFTGRIEACRRSVLWLTATFLGCYLLFLAIPVAGPYYEFPRPDPVIMDNPMARLVYATLAKGSSYGAAFPSSHVAAAIVAVVAGFLGARWIGWTLTVPSILLCLGVVYCQMHYGVDALAGGAVALIVTGFGCWAERGRQEKESRTEARHRASQSVLDSSLSPQS